jgi:hypothetical protein
MCPGLRGIDRNHGEAGMLRWQSRPATTSLVDGGLEYSDAFVCLMKLNPDGSLLSDLHQDLALSSSSIALRKSVKSTV